MYGSVFYTYILIIYNSHHLHIYLTGEGSSCNSQCIFDRGPPDYHEVVRLSRLQSSDPYSVWEPEHLCESGTFNICDGQISTGERQEVPVMPEGRLSSPPLSGECMLQSIIDFHFHNYQCLLFGDACLITYFIFYWPCIHRNCHS